MSPGHAVDPLQYMLVRRLMTLQRMVAKRPDLHQLIKVVWKGSQHCKIKFPGPIQLVAEAAEQVGWIWSSPFEVICHDGQP
eukprot:5890414-Karenia_brevis.AAC.1